MFRSGIAWRKRIEKRSEVFGVKRKKCNAYAFGEAKKAYEQRTPFPYNEDALYMACKAYMAAQDEGDPSAVLCEHCKKWFAAMCPDCGP